LDSLKDSMNKLDQQSEEVAKRYHNLAHAIFLQKENLKKAENLTRETLSIRSQLYEDSHENVGHTSDLLACILQSQDNFGNETKELIERSLAVDIRTSGAYGVNTTVGYARLGKYYHRLAEARQTRERIIEYLRLSHFKYEEAI
jgi:hypothetical protein